MAGLSSKLYTALTTNSVSRRKHYTRRYEGN